MAAIKYGIALPHTEIEPDPVALRDWAQGVEALGFHHVRVPEHVLGANPASRPDWHGLYDLHTPFYEPMTLIPFLAAHTSVLQFATTILILPQRQTVLVAKQAACVDLLCGGRWRMGIGVGWNELEYDALGVDFRARGDIYEEQIGVLRALWTSDAVTLDLPHHRIDDAGICPLPVQRPIPLWMGGGMDPSQAKPAGERVLRRIARLADGWLPVCAPESDAAQRMFEQFHGFAREYGRDPASIGIEGSIRDAKSDQHKWPARIAAWRALGATHIGINTMGNGLSGVAEHLRDLEEVKAIIDGA
jgi:probable F420-dependent oxidoreductase